MYIEGKGLLCSAQCYENKEKVKKQIFKVLVQQPDKSDCELITCIQDYNSSTYETIIQYLDKNVLVCGDYAHGFAKYTDIKIIK